MNIFRYENEAHKAADKQHKLAQDTGNWVLYETAAVLYEKAGDFNSARICREAAERLREVEA